MRRIRWTGLPRNPPESSPGGRRQSGVFSLRTQKVARVESQADMQPRKTVQTIGIISRPRRSNLVVVVPPLLKWLEAHGIQSIIDEETASSFPVGSKGLARNRSANVFQIALVHV